MVLSIELLVLPLLSAEDHEYIMNDGAIGGAAIKRFWVTCASDVSWWAGGGERSHGRAVKIRFLRKLICFFRFLIELRLQPAGRQRSTVAGANPKVGPY